MQVTMHEPELETSTALTLPQRAAVALNSSKTRAELIALVKKSSAIVEVKNTAGREECHSAAMSLVRARTSVEKIGKTARDDATKFSKAVIAEENELIAITKPEESRLLVLRDAWDNARAAERAEAERIERARITVIHARIADIKAMGLLALECRTSAKVEELIEKLVAMPIDGFDEFDEEAATASGLTLARMKEISDQKFEDEQERARVKAEQAAEDVRLKAERAELDRERAEVAEARKAQFEEAKRNAIALEELARELNAEEAKAVREIAAPPIPKPEPENIPSTPAAASDVGPTDAEVIGCAIVAVANFFNLSRVEASNRLAAIQEWPQF
jgi:hypothetical protein